MAACGGLEHIFEKPLPAWKSVDHSISEIFCPKENILQSSTSLSSSLSSNSNEHKCPDSVSPSTTCTDQELASDDDDNNEIYYNNDLKPNEKYNWPPESRRCSRKQDFGTIPPPISCLGRNGKPWVFFKSIRKDGRFILKEIRIPTQEFLHACRKNGRLKLHFIHSDDEINLDDEDDDDDDDDDISETEAA